MSALLQSLFYWIGTSFRIDAYLPAAKAAGVVCAWADIAAVYYFILITDRIRRRRPSRIRLTVLVLFAVITPALLLPKNSTLFFIIQFAILAPPYLLLFYSAATEAKTLVEFLKGQCIQQLPKGS